MRVGVWVCLLPEKPQYYNVLHTLSWQVCKKIFFTMAGLKESVNYVNGASKGCFNNALILLLE